MAAWRTYGVVVGLVLCPVIALAGQSQGSQRAGQQERSQPAQYSAEQLQQIQQLGRQGEQQQQTLTIDRAIRQAQQEAKGVVVEAALSFEAAPEQSRGQRSRGRQQAQSSEQSQGSQSAGGHPSWQIQVLNPEEGRLTQFQVDAETGQITNRQEYPIQQVNR
jgi:uncharacterized membrane protein YkoI